VTYSLEEWCAQAPWGWQALHARVSALETFVGSVGAGVHPAALAVVRGWLSEARFAADAGDAAAVDAWAQAIRVRIGEERAALFQTWGPGERNE
jgi:hypothetical protein